MPELEIPLNPVSREDIHRLEAALMVATLLREDVLEKIKESTERLTWIDSLAVAAGALARYKAGMSISEIAEDLGRSEATIRRHLQAKTEAGKLVQETYEKFLKEGVRVDLPRVLAERELEVEKQLEEEKKKIKELEEKLSRVRNLLETALKELSDV